jgi:hypothetical protein
MHKRLLCLLGFLACASPARAGMTVYGLNDVVRLRLEDISFFLLLLVVSAAGIRMLWNYLARDFARLPRLSFLKAFSLTVLLSLAILLVLVMISGAREVLTPGAWYRQGSHYRPNDIGNLEMRRQSMENLRAALVQYAAAHDQRYPPHSYVLDIPEKLWQAPDMTGTRYVYIGGRSLNQSNDVVACEPLNFGETRFVLFGSGRIASLGTAEIRRALGSSEPR